MLYNKFNNFIYLHHKTSFKNYYGTLKKLNLKRSAQK